MDYVSCQSRRGRDVGRCCFFVLGPGRQEQIEELKRTFFYTVKTPV